MKDKLFNSSGYISAKDYVENINDMQKNGPWKLPLDIGDRFHLTLLRFFLSFSWFNGLYIKYPHDYSPAYDIIISFLKRKKMLSKMVKLNSVYFRDICMYSLYLLDGDSTVVRSTGHDKESDVALSKAIGELIERSVSGVYDENNDVVFGSFNELKSKYKNIFYPPIYHRFLPQQKELFKELRVDDNQKISWVKGINFLSNEIALIPQSLTSWRYRGDMLLMNPTTNGGAASFSNDDATRNSILEYIERDSFFVHWLTQIAPKVIENKSLPEDLFSHIKILNDMGITVYVLNTTTDINIPSISVAMRVNNSNRNAVAVSGGAGFSFHQAIEKALKEAVQCVGGLFAQGDSIDVTDIAPFVGNINRDKRVAMWQGDEWVKLFSWFISGDVVKYKDNKESVLETKDEMAFLKNIFSKLGKEYTPLIYFPKNKAMNKLGFHVAQSFIPFCFPLFLLEKYGTFDSDRLKQFAEYKGFKDFKLNPYPHPFP